MKQGAMRTGRGGVRGIEANFPVTAKCVSSISLRRYISLIITCPPHPSSPLFLSYVLTHSRLVSPLVKEHPLLLTTHRVLLRSLPTAYCLLLTAYCLLRTTYYLLLTTYCLLLITCHLLVTTSSSLLTAYYLLPTNNLLPTTYYLPGRRTHPPLHTPPREAGSAE